MYSLHPIANTQSCLTLCDPMDCSPPGSSVHGIFQAWILEWFAISFSRGYSWSRDRTWVSCTAGRFFPEQKLQFAFVFHRLQCGRLGFDPLVGKIPWRRERLPIPVFWPAEFHGQRSLAGYSPWSCKESNMTEWLSLSIFTFSSPWTLGSWTVVLTLVARLGNG